jgi:putative flavoprotein involved in K+ transport
MLWDCVVVGAGAAGVATSRALAEAGVEHLVLERGEIAHTWATQRWDSFRLNTPGWMNPVLGTLEPGDYSTRDETVALVRKGADGLPVRRHSGVSALAREGDLLVLRTADDELRARTVVVASGAKNRPVLPGDVAHLAPHLTWLHVADYRRAEGLPDGGVLVVGGGQSGAQVADDLVRSGREVWFSTSRVGRYPSHYRGRELLAWHVDAGWWSQRADQLPDPNAKYLATPLLASNGRDIGLPALARMGVNLLGRLASVEGSRLAFTGDVSDFVSYADDVALGLERLVDDHISVAGLDAPPASRDEGRGPVDVPARPTIDLDGAGISTVVWCTGFGPDLTWLPSAVLDERGLPVLDGPAAAGLPNLMFVGMPWQSTRASAILHGMPLDVQRAVAGVLAQLVRTGSEATAG